MIDSALVPTRSGPPGMAGESRDLAEPARLYLASLAPSGRRSQAAALERIARFVSNDQLGWRELPWGRLGYREAAAVVDWLKATYASPATANTYRAALRGVARECWRLGLIDAEQHARIRDLPPITGSREPRGRALTSEERRRLIDQLEREGTLAAVRDIALIGVLYSSGGVRVSEAVALRLEDWNPRERSLTLVGKGNKERSVWLPDDAAADLERWLRARGSAPGFLMPPIASDRVTVLHHRPLSASTVRALCGRLARRVGIEHFTPHDFRRSSISDLIDDSGDLALVARIAGHAQTPTTAKYDRRPEAAMRRAARRLSVR